MDENQTQKPMGQAIQTDKARISDHLDDMGGDGRGKALTRCWILKPTACVERAGMNAARAERTRGRAFTSGCMNARPEMG